MAWPTCDKELKRREEAARSRIEAFALSAIGKKGIRMSDLATQVGFSVATIRAWARQAGVPIRSPQVKPTYIYCLKSPVDGQIYYVGKANNPAQRLKMHIRQPTSAYMADWIDSLGLAGHKPKVIILAHLNHNRHEWRAIELQFITKYKNLGCPLLNMEVAGWSGAPIKRVLKASEIHALSQSTSARHPVS